MKTKFKYNSKQKNKLLKLEYLKDKVGDNDNFFPTPLNNPINSRVW